MLPDASVLPPDCRALLPAIPSPPDLGEPLVSVIALVDVGMPVPPACAGPAALPPPTRRIAEFIGGCNTLPLVLDAAPRAPAALLPGDALAPIPPLPDAPACNNSANMIAVTMRAPPASRSSPLHQTLFNLKVPGSIWFPRQTSVGKKVPRRYSDGADRGAVRRSRWCPCEGA